MTYQYVLVDRDEDITTITLDRPEKRNTLAVEVMRELLDAFAAVGESDALGVILAANGPVLRECLHFHGSLKKEPRPSL